MLFDPKIITRYSLRWLTAISLMIALPSVAALNPTNTPIKISADNAERDEKLGITTYSGNVSIQQGPLSINAAKVVIHNDDKNVSTIVATGSPASLSKSKEHEADEGELQASGNTITYSLEDGLIQLEDNAKVNQGGSTVSGQKIEYFIAKQLVKAQGGASEGSTQRVETVIMPSPRDENDNTENSFTHEQP